MNLCRFFPEESKAEMPQSQHMHKSFKKKKGYDVMYKKSCLVNPIKGRQCGPRQFIPKGLLNDFEKKKKKKLLVFVYFS